MRSSTSRTSTKPLRKRVIPSPLSKTYRTCHKPEVDLILLSNRFENLPKSSGHGNGIAVFFARCFFYCLA